MNVAERPEGATTTIADTARADRPRGLVAGEVIAGRYTLLEVLGEGGMGTVYRADQTEPVKRQVALKLIKVGMDSRAVLARFDAERQALALMDHPNIARVYDGGTTAAGQPFFVMELVSGVPITEYCDRHRLPVRARLELFVSVCHAVQHAHQKGIIHRDLKPSNVLVTEVDGRPTPKVIDFGVAKATEFTLTDQSQVDSGAIVGTPAYMSPEQGDHSSMDIDTRTDVYALGVILYELLAGSPPIDVKQFQRGAFLEMLRIVREVDPPRPSTKLGRAEALPNIAASRNTEPEQLKRMLRGDLDWIVMKALEKDRARRYETSNGFAADVIRHLSHEPVLAAPPSRAYRLRKFVRKHRGAVVAVSLVVLALLAGIAGTTWGFFREAERVKERDEAVKVADSRADELKYRLGISDFLLASAAYDNSLVVLAAERLDKVPPEQRGWEWGYLTRLTRGGLFTLYGHVDGVSSVSFSADGTRIVSGSDDCTAKVWDARTGTPLLELRGHAGCVWSASFNPDATRIVTSSLDDTAKVWDARTGTPLLLMEGHTNGVQSLSFSPDGTRIVTGSYDKTAKVWDARTGTTLRELKGHAGYVESVSFSPDGTRIVTGSLDGTAKVWDAETGTPLLELNGHESGVSSVSFSPDATRIVTGSGDETVKVWDARTGTHSLSVTVHSGEVYSASFSPDGARIITNSFDGTAKVWDAQTGTLLDTKERNVGRSRSFSPDRMRIVTADRETANVWDARTGARLLTLKGDGVIRASFSPDGTRIVAGSRFTWARVWDARTGMRLLELNGHKDGVNGASFSPDATRIVTVSDDQTVKVWDARTGTPLLELKGHVDRVCSVSFSPDGTRIITGGGDGTAKVWDARTGMAPLALSGHTDKLRSVSFSPDGTRIVTGGDDQTVKVWDARTGTRLLDLEGHSRAVTSVSFGPDGTRIVTGSYDGTAKVWDARTGTPLLEPSTGGGECVSYSPDGTQIVTGDGVALGRVWDARTGSLMAELKGHSGYGQSLSFSTDGTRVLQRSNADGPAKVWDARTGRTLTGEPLRPAPRSARISPDGRWTLTRSATASN